MNMSEFTHMDEKGRVRMVDVGDKTPTHRKAVARASISMTPETFKKIISNTVIKGNVLETARIAGIMGAKQTPGLIPMCHPIQIRHAAIDFTPDAALHTINIIATIQAFDVTGVEMEAMTAVTIAALTIYDMCKSHDRAMTISDICLVEKSGGKSGVFVRDRLSHNVECL
jgi:cyclic pyranopterin monophosphate synthase